MAANIVFSHNGLCFYDDGAVVDREKHKRNGVPVNPIEWKYGNQFGPAIAVWQGALLTFLDSDDSDKLWYTLHSDFLEAYRAAIARLILS